MHICMQHTYMVLNLVFIPSENTLGSSNFCPWRNIGPNKWGHGNKWHFWWFCRFCVFGIAWHVREGGTFGERWGFGWRHCGFSLCVVGSGQSGSMIDELNYSFLRRGVSGRLSHKNKLTVLLSPFLGNIYLSKINKFRYYKKHQSQYGWNRELKRSVHVYKFKRD